VPIEGKFVERRLGLEKPFGAGDDDTLEAAQDAEALGRELGRRLLDAGGRDILSALARRSA